MSGSERAGGASARTGPLPLVAVCLGYFMVILDATAVNLSLPALGRDLGGGMSALQWVVDGYTLTFAGLLLTGGALGDRLGSRDVFLAGLGLFVAASAVCGLAPNIAVLVVARLVQGAAAAILVPASLALLAAGYPDPAARARAVGVWGGIAGIAAASGPVIGGVLTETVSWRLVFMVNVPIGVVALALTVRHVVRPSGHERGLDPVAQLVAVCALGALTFALIEGGERGWAEPMVLGAFGAAVAVGVAFVLIERRVGAPMLPLGLFRDRAFGGGNAIGALINLGFYGQLFTVALYLQQVRDMSPLMGGLALLPEGVLVSLASFMSGRMSARTGTRPTMLVGLCVGACGFGGLAATVGTASYLALVAPLAAIGFGMAFTMPAATTTVVAAAPTGRAGIASGAVNASRQVGSTVGVALLGGLAGTAGVTVGGMRTALIVAAAVFACGAAIAAFMPPRRARTGEEPTSTARRPSRTGV